MAVIYATLIVKGKKTINDVPPVIRESESRLSRSSLILIYQNLQSKPQGES